MILRVPPYDANILVPNPYSSTADMYWYVGASARKGNEHKRLGPRWVVLCSPSGAFFRCDRVLLSRVRRFGRRFPSSTFWLCCIKQYNQTMCSDLNRAILRRVHGVLDPVSPCRSTEIFGPQQKGGGGMARSQRPRSTKVWASLNGAVQVAPTNY